MFCQGDGNENDYFINGRVDGLQLYVPHHEDGTIGLSFVFDVLPIETLREIDWLVCFEP